MILARVRLLSVALGLAALTMAPAGRADVPPSPQRPAWDQEPPPLPPPPPEKELERAALIAFAVLAVALAARAARVQRHRAPAEPRS